MSRDHFRAQSKYMHTYTQDMKLWNFGHFFFPTSLVVGSGILHIKLCAFGCTYMCFLGIHTCFGPFWVIPNSKSVRTMRFCIRLNFWNDAVNTYFWAISPLKVVLKLHSGFHRQNFLGVSGPLNMRHNGQEGLWGSEIVEKMSQILLVYSGNDSKIFQKKIEFGRFRQDCLGQIK